MACVSDLEDAYTVDWITCVSDLEDAYTVDWITCVSDLEDAYNVDWITCVSDLEDAYIVGWITCVSDLEDAYIVDWITCVSDLEDANIVDWITCVSDLEDAYIVERLFASSLVAIVNQQHPRKLKVCHFKKGTEICNYSYSGSILNCKLNRQVADQWKKLSWLSVALLLCLFGCFNFFLLWCRGVLFLDCWVLLEVRQVVLILFTGFPEDAWVLGSFSWLV